MKSDWVIFRQSSGRHGCLPKTAVNAKTWNPKRKIVCELSNTTVQEAIKECVRRDAENGENTD